ncbi:MAG: oligosaccharide flippase family protein [Pseudomonadota bacterium]
MSAVSSMRQMLETRVRPALGDGTSALVGLQILTAVLRLCSSIILTRLLVPTDYALAGIVTAVLVTLNLVADLGLFAYVTRHASADHNTLKSVWTARLFRNGILALCMYFGAGAIASLYNAPELKLAMQVAASIFIIDSFASLSLFTAQRERRVLRVSVLEFAKYALVTLVTIIAAAYLRNYWAIIIGSFAGSLFFLYASYRLIPGPMPGFRINREELLELWKFSRFIIPASLISIVLTQTDKFYFANFFSKDELGKFMLAASLAIPAGTIVKQYSLRVFFPLYAQKLRAGVPEPQRVYYDSRWRITLAFALCIGGVIGGADLIVKILFNEDYAGTGLYLSLIFLAPLARLNTQPAENAVQAHGFIRATLTANVLRALWIGLAGGAAFWLFDPFAVVVAICLREIAMIPFFWWNQHRFKIFNLWRELIVYAVAGVGVLIGFSGKSAIFALVENGILPNF